MRAREPEPEPIGGGLGRLFRTLAPIGPTRVLARALRPARARWRGILHAAGATPGSVQWTGLTVPEWPAHEDTWDPPGRFRFLGQERDLGGPPRWDAAASRLWNYHLHYLDGLRQTRIPRSARRGLLEGWVAANRPGAAPGWEPYPTALRLVNALAFLAADEQSPPRAVLDSLALQAWWLAGTLEWDVGANHLWKDALALSWAGRLLSGGSAPRWRRQGEALLRRELRRQMLADGFHVERTPTYHALLVEDLIRLDALLAASGEASLLLDEVRDALGRAGAALATVLHPDGEVTLLNDSALGQAPRGDALVAAVEERLGRPVRPLPGGLPEAGILRLESAGSVVFFDVGETGDRAQPGHAHADTLTLEASFSGRRVIVDAGVHDYELSDTRRYARGTRAHNTVTIDDAEQSEVWGVFRVGRRARPLDVSGDGAAASPWASAAHDGYRVLPGAPVHRRRIQALPGGGFRIEDEVTGGGLHRVRAALRVHPDLTAEARGGAVTIEGPGLRLQLTAEQGPPLQLEDGWYFPRMGEKRRCAVAVVEVESALPVRLVCRIEPVPVDDR